MGRHVSQAQRDADKEAKRRRDTGRARALEALNDLLAQHPDRECMLLVRLSGSSASAVRRLLELVQQHVVGGVATGVIEDGGPTRSCTYAAWVVIWQGQQSAVPSERGRTAAGTLHPFHIAWQDDLHLEAERMCRLGHEPGRRIVLADWSPH
ncbi:hypothetical protein MNEG_12847, partial [Monoraphidium neglectum]